MDYKKTQQNPNLLNQKYSCINLEDIEYKKLYSFSINPEKQYYNNCMRYSPIINDIERILIKYQDNIQYYLQFEISPKGRWHAHGLIVFIKEAITVYEELLYDLQQKCVYEIDTIDDHYIWKNYINKQLPKIQEKYQSLQIGNKELYKALERFAEKIEMSQNLTAEEIESDSFSSYEGFSDSEPNYSIKSPFKSKT